MSGSIPSPANNADRGQLIQSLAAASASPVVKSAHKRRTASRRLSILIDDSSAAALALEAAAPMFHSPVSLQRQVSSLQMAQKAAADSITSPRASVVTPLVTEVKPPAISRTLKAHLESLPDYTDSEFTAAADEWKKQIEKSKKTTVLADGEKPQTNADGFTPRTAILLDRSWLLPARLAKRLARGFSNPSLDIARYQTKQFRDVFAPAAVGEEAALESRLKKQAEGVELLSAQIDPLRPHLSAPISAAKLKSGEAVSIPPVKQQQASASKLPPETFFKRAEDLGHATPKPKATLVSKTAITHPPAMATDAPNPGGLMFADITATKPGMRTLNRVDRSDPIVSSDTASKKKKAPLSALAAEDDRIHAEEDAVISDVEIGYDSLVNTDDSDNEDSDAEPAPDGVVAKKDKKKKSTTLNPNSQLSATMLVLAGVVLPDWPHSIESEDEIENHNPETMGIATKSDLEDSDEENAERETDDLYQRSRHEHRERRPNPYAVAAAAEEADLKFLAGEGLPAADASPNQKSNNPEEMTGLQQATAMVLQKKHGLKLDSIHESNDNGEADDEEGEECFEHGKRVRISHAARKTALHKSLAGLTALERASVVQAENLLKRLAKESLKVGGRYEKLSEDQILAQLEVERLREADRIKRETGADRVMPSVMQSPSNASASGSNHRRMLSDLTPMQQKNLSEKEMAMYAKEEAEAVKVGDGHGGRANHMDAVEKESRSFLKQLGKTAAFGDKSVMALHHNARMVTRPIADAQGHILAQFRKPPPVIVKSDVGENTDHVKAKEVVPLALRPAFKGSALPSSLDRVFPPAKALPDIELRASLRPPRALGMQVERWLRKHGQVVRKKLDPAELAKYRAIFSLLDEDGSGTLSLSELQNALKDINVHMSLSELSIMANEIKAESLRSQSIRRRNLIDFSEFVNGLARAGEWDTLCILADQRKQVIAHEKRRAEKFAERQARDRERRASISAEAATRIEAGQSIVDMVNEHENPFHVPMPEAIHDPLLLHAVAANAKEVDGNLLLPANPGRRFLFNIPSAAETVAASPNSSRSSSSSQVDPPAVSAPTLTLRTSHSAVTLDSAPIIGGAGLVIDSVTGENVPVHEMNLHLDQMKDGASDEILKPIPLTSRSGNTNNGSTQRSSKPHHLKRLSVSSSTPSLGTGGRKVPSTTSDLLPFTLWVPAYNRYKKLDKMMAIENVSDQTLQALIDEENREDSGENAKTAGSDNNLDQHTLSLVGGGGGNTGPVQVPSRKHGPAIAMVSSSGTYITPEELWESHNYALIEEDITVENEDGTIKRMKGKPKKIFIPTPAHLEATSSINVPTLASTTRALDQVASAEDARAAARRRDLRESGVSISFSMEASEDFRRSLYSNPREDAEEKTNAPKRLHMRTHSIREEGSEEPTGPQTPRLLSPLGVKTIHSTQKLRGKINEEQTRLQAKGNAFDFSEVAGKDMYHPDPARSYLNETEAKEAAIARAIIKTGLKNIANGEGSLTARLAASALANTNELSPSKGGDPSGEPSFTADIESTQSAQSLPFLWRQTQENVRVSRLASEAAAARAELDALLKSEAASGDVNAAEHVKKQNVAREKHMALVKETESKRITREIFESSNAKAKAKLEAEKTRRIEEEKRAVKLAKERKAQGLDSEGKPSKEMLLATKFSPPPELSFQANNLAAQTFATAASCASLTETGISTQMLAASQHLKREQADNARHVAVAEARRKARSERLHKELVEEARLEAERRRQEEERKRKLEEEQKKNGGAARSSQVSSAQSSSRVDASKKRPSAEGSPVSSLPGSHRGSVINSLASPMNKLKISTNLTSPFAAAPPTTTTISSNPAIGKLSASEKLIVPIMEGPTAADEEFLPLPSLDFLTGSRLRAQLHLETAKKEQLLQKLNKLDHFEQLALLDEEADTGKGRTSKLAEIGSSAKPATVTAALAAGLLDAPAIMASQKQNEKEIKESMARLRAEVDRDEKEGLENLIQPDLAASMDPFGKSVSSIPGAPATDFTSITRLWSDATRHIEESRRQLREKAKSDAVRARQEKQAKYAAQVKQAYGDAILNSNTVLSPSNRAHEEEDEDYVFDVAEARHDNLRRQLASVGQISSPTANLKRNTMLDPISMQFVPRK